MDRLVVGLGNPGPRYAATRHNAGFQVVDRVARRIGGRWGPPPPALVEKRLLVACGSWGSVDVLLAKPLTYMNASGNAVAPLVHAWGGSLEHFLLVFDDLDLPPGYLRLRPGGRDGGHRGVRSVVAALGTGEFPRLRVGIGRPEATGATAVLDWVLGVPEGEEATRLARARERGAEAVLFWAEAGIEAAMSRYNGPA